MTEQANSTNPGRRAFLTSAVAASAAAMLGTTAAVALQPDPVFAAIEAHKVARVVMYSAVDAVSAREKELTAEGKRYSCDRKGDIQLGECESALQRAFDAEADAACELVGNPPVTMAGVIALLEYATAADTDGDGWPSDLQSEDGKRTRTWQFFLIEMLADALPGMVRP